MRDVLVRIELVQSSLDSTRAHTSIFAGGYCKIFSYIFDEVYPIECQFSSCCHMLLKRQCFIQEGTKKFDCF